MATKLKAKARVRTKRTAEEKRIEAIHREGYLEQVSDAIRVTERNVDWLEDCTGVGNDEDGVLQVRIALKRWKTILAKAGEYEI